MTTNFAIYGTGGAGRQVMPFARENLSFLPGDPQLVFIDDAQTSQTKLNGHDVLPLEDWIAQSPAAKRICLAVSDGRLRERLALRCLSKDIDFFSVRAGSVIVLDEVQIGEGAILSAYVLITSNVKIGKHFYANHYSHIAHDCVIGDYVTFAPGVRCNGNVHIHDHAYIGTGAMLRQGTPDKPLIIGEGAVVGMGAVVTKDVAPHTVVVGNPARPLKRE